MQKIDFKKLKDEIASILEKTEKEKRVMQLNRILADKKNIKKLLLVADILLMVCFNFLINTLVELFTEENIWEILKIFPLPKGIIIFWWLYLIFLLFLLICDITWAYKIKVSFSEENFNVNQKGSSRFTTVEELKQQYRQIDEREGEYDGLPGFLISTHEGKHFIDDGNTNTITIGITRAGKDKIYVEPNMNNYSRAKIKPSMVITALKGEEYRAAKKRLEKRGYKTLLYNLSNPKYSISINYLANMLKLYKQGDYATAELMAYSYSYSIFCAGEKTKAENDFFTENAAALFSALIIAHITDCLEEDEKYNHIRKLKFQEKQEKFLDLPEEEQEQARENLKQYQGEDYVLDDTVHYIPDDVTFEKIEKYEKCVNIYSIIVMFSELSRKRDENGISELDRYFNMRPATDRAKLKYLSIDLASDRASGDIYSSMAIKLTNFSNDAIIKISLENELDMEELGFGEQPIALFIVFPDYDSSLHTLASILIRQSYIMLSRMCDEHMTCKRPVKYILNEFGNMPLIEGMTNMLTVGLGRNITFDLYIQSIKRIQKIYGDKDAATIIANCGNQIYLMGNDTETAEYFSKMLGEITYIDIQRSGSKLSLNKTFTERTEKKPLMSASDLRELKKGHSVVRRAMKRTDLDGNDIRPRPIYNRAEDGTKLKFSYDYLQGILEDPRTIRLSEIAPETKEISNIEEYIMDFDKVMKRLEENVPAPKKRKKELPKVKTLASLSQRHYALLESYAMDGIGEDYKEILNWSHKLPLEELYQKIEGLEFMKKESKKTMLSILEGRIDEK